MWKTDFPLWKRKLGNYACKWHENKAQFREELLLTF